MESLIGIGVALSVAAVAARSIIREAAPGGAHRAQRGAMRAPDPPATDTETQRTEPAATQAPAIAPPRPRTERAAILNAPTDFRAPRETSPQTRGGHSDNGLVITPFRPPRPPAQPRRRLSSSVSVNLVPGARIEVVDLDDAPALRHPALRPDPDRLIQTEIVLPTGPVARALAFTRLMVGVLSFGVLLGVGIVFGVRLIVAFFEMIF